MTMEEIVLKSRCTGCAACASICPKNAIEMKIDNNGFKYPYINKEKCIDCGLCKKICPVLASNKEEKQKRAYACYNNNEFERLASSSGGIFVLLAKWFIQNNGVVFGACFDDSFCVVHSYAENEDDLKKFMTSKYVQSDLKDSFKKVKEFLSKGRYVLFTGTPCQVEGLISYLGKNYDRLYTQDIVCHGVPSPKVWEKYKEYRKDVDSDSPKEINFRNKDNGWSQYNYCFKYNDKIYKSFFKDDLFSRAFLNNISLRESCYDCTFKNCNRNSDITLADFWGINNILPEMNDNKGVSLIIVNSLKGRNLLDSIKAEITIKETNYEEAIKYNPSYSVPATKNSNREKFFKDLDEMSFDKLVNKYIHKKSFIKKLLLKIKSRLKNL